MSLRVLLIPDKFKGTLTASQAANAIAAGWRKVRPTDRLTLLPMSDGGDGFGGIFGGLLGATPRTLQTVDAAYRRVRAQWWFAPSSRTAIVESANVIGLAMLPAGRFHPFELDTFGLGAVLNAAARIGARHCLIGIGGSATNDGGFGMARALGWQFLDERSMPIQRWTELDSLSRIVPPTKPPLKRMKVVVAVDVQNPLLGPRGASRVYGPQKGLRSSDFIRAERCLRRMAEVMRRTSGKDHAATPGAGAAGGLGFGLFAFAGARAESGIDLFSRHARLRRRLRAVDLVITGEGSTDRSTLMGKGVGDIARLCQQLRIPCIGLAGVARNERAVRRVFASVSAITPGLTTPENARTQPARWLKKLAAVVGEDWQSRVRGRSVRNRRNDAVTR
jgi:glycerate kinase